MEKLTVDGAGLYSKQVQRKRNDLTNSRLGFNTVHDSIRERGTVRPVRDLPSIFSKGSAIDKEGYIFSQGKILGKYDRRTYTGGAWEYNVNQGLSNTNGKFYGFRDNDGVAQQVDYDDTKWGNSSDIEGLVAPLNGNGNFGGTSNSSVIDTFTQRDIDLGIISPKTGNLITTTSDSASVREYAGSGALKLFGVAKADTMRETRNNHMNYFKNTEAITVIKQGYITVPFITSAAVIGADSYTLNDSTNADNFKLSKDQSVLFLESRDLIETGAVVHVDAYGNPIIASNSNTTYDDVEFGHIVSFNHNVTLPFGEMTATVPGMELAGTGTKGIEYDIFYLARKAFPNATDKEIGDYLKSNAGMLGYATIYFDIP